MPKEPRWRQRQRARKQRDAKQYPNPLRDPERVLDRRGWWPSTYVYFLALALAGLVILILSLLKGRL